jgi:hypothetical protein
LHRRTGGDYEESFESVVHNASRSWIEYFGFPIAMLIAFLETAFSTAVPDLTG